MAQVHDGSKVCADTVDVGVDKKLIVGPEQRVVEDCLMQPELDTFNGRQVAIVEDGIADLGCHCGTNALVFATLGYLRAVGVAEEHADCDAGLGLVPEELMEGSVL